MRAESNVGWSFQESGIEMKEKILQHEHFVRAPALDGKMRNTVVSQYQEQKCRQNVYVTIFVYPRNR